ncbi:MAG: lipoate--protein ligase [Saccharofermentans sp.]|nr:lipoate--protein ligase [Saccharofermentans sp.]
MSGTLILQGNSFDPYYNLAVEETLAGYCAGKYKALYLWQNDNTVVIGKNQALCAEVDLEYAGTHDIRLARRVSGGGAVYHDKGNLNFTFAGSQNETDIIVRAMTILGFNVQTTGRNDIEIVSDRISAKFSGNAYYKSGCTCFHHGTILIDTDFDVMSKVLTPDKDKLEGHGVKSVKSRVVNLCEVMPTITVDDVKSAIIKAFEEKFGKSDAISITELDASEAEKARVRLASREWIYGC